MDSQLLLFGQETITNSGGGLTVLKMMATFLYAAVSYVMTVGFFIFGFSTAMINVLKMEAQNAATINHLVKITVIPYLFMILGIVGLLTLATFFEFLYNQDIYTLLNQFLEKQQIDTSSLVGTPQKIATVLNNVIGFLSNFILNSALLTYLLIPVFYISNGAKVFLPTAGEGSPFKKIFYFSLYLILGVMMAVIFDNLISSVYFKIPLEYNNTQVTSLGQFATLKAKEWVLLGFQ